ncbi:hypothetical protein GF402_09810 [Candidatus Fermentibacteria bacterium]|nr:hypothetical protein [Candidatus Fermentibacteria bacterium]
MKLCIPLVAIVIAWSASAAPEFGECEVLLCAGVPIHVGNHGSPCLADWDGDGLEDLITGQFDQGRIRLYPNEGTNPEPVYNRYEYLEADGKPIKLPYG